VLLVEEIGFAIDLLPDFLGFYRIDVFEGLVLVDVRRIEIAHFTEFGETYAEDLLDQFYLCLGVVSCLRDLTDHFQLGFEVTDYFFVAFELLSCCLAWTIALLCSLGLVLYLRPLV
jgi:hypothetical protein